MTHTLIRVALVASCLVGVASIRVGSADHRASPHSYASEASETPDTAALERDFFDALNVNPQRRGETLARLERAVAAGDRTPRIILLLGLNHLWFAAEGDVPEVERRRHSIQAIHELERARTLLPEDHRIPSWLHAAEFGLAVTEGRHEDATAAREKLVALAADEPCFHAVALAITSFDEPRESDAFRRALAAMEASFACRGDNPSIVDMPRWPHNVHGFLVALADFRLKAGDLHGAEMALAIAEARPGYETWSHRQLVARRFDAIAARRDRLAGSDDPLPPFIFARGGNASCIGCHGQ